MGVEKYYHKNKRPQRWWEENDSTLLHDQMRVLFGEELYLQEYCYMASFKELLNGQQSGPTGMAVEDPDFGTAFPQLYLLMAKTSDDDGKPRIPCTLTIVCEDGQVKCGVNERNYHLALWTSSASLGGAFQSLEEALAQRPVPWRKTTWKGSQGKR